MRHAIAIACLLALTACAHATAHDRDGIPLPRPPRAGEGVLLEVRLGVIGSGQEIVVRTADGRLVGTVSPHGIHPGKGAGTYLVPVPDDILSSSLSDGRLHLQFSVERAGAAARPATGEEVLDARATITAGMPPP